MSIRFLEVDMRKKRRSGRSRAACNIELLSERTLRETRPSEIALGSLSSEPTLQIPTPVMLVLANKIGSY